MHLIGRFDNPFTGAERELPDLARCLQGRRRAVLWSDVPPHPVYRQMGVRAIRSFAGDAPRGGMILLSGVHVGVGIEVWLPKARARRIAVRYNLPRHARLYELVSNIRNVVGLEPELLFASKALQLGAGLPGVMEPSLIVLDDYLKTPLARPLRPFTVGRVSRDEINKHHPDDAAVYRVMAARGWRVRIMGGSCLAPWLGDVEGIELLPSGAMPVSEFYAGIDAMFYRTGGFNEAYGRVVFEAMASGLPVVVKSGHGYAEQIASGDNGFVFDTQEEAFAILEALAVQPDLRLQVGQAARRRAVELHGPAAIEAQMQFYLRG